MNISDKDKEKLFKLGASAPALEGIRDILRIHHEQMERHYKQAQRGVETANNWLARLREDIDEYDEWIEFIDDIIKGNANTIYQHVEEA